VRIRLAFGLAGLALLLTAQPASARFSTNASGRWQFTAVNGYPVLLWSSWNWNHNKAPHSVVVVNRFGRGNHFFNGNGNAYGHYKNHGNGHSNGHNGGPGGSTGGSGGSSGGTGSTPNIGGPPPPVSNTPEPVTMTLLASGLAALGGVGLRRKKKGSDVAA